VGDEGEAGGAAGAAAAQGSAEDGVAAQSDEVKSDHDGLLVNELFTLCSLCTEGRGLTMRNLAGRTQDIVPEWT
jgi:hypothetical protein